MLVAVAVGIFGALGGLAKRVEWMNALTDAESNIAIV